MAIKYEKIRPGMTLYDRHRERAGNTTLRRLGEWPVEIISLQPERRAAVVSWNHNRPVVYSERILSSLYDWSMYDRTEAERVEGIGGTVRVKRLPAAERKRRKAERAAQRAASVSGEEKR